MQTQPLFASAMFACRSPHLADAARFDALLEAIASAVAPLPLSYRFTISANGGMSRGKPLHNRDEVSRLWSRGTTSELHVTSLHPDAHVGSKPYAQIAFRRNPVRYQRSSSENFLQNVSLMRTIGTSETSGFVRGAQRIFGLLDALSGYVHVATDDTLALGELGFQAMSPLGPLPELRSDGTADVEAGRTWLNWKHPEDTNDRIRQLALVRSQVGPRLRGTYWGTFLSREMVEELGGETRIRREAPVSLVESLERGGMYLQLTPMPEPITSPALQLGLPALERFLEPVLVPTPLYFATRNRST